MNYRLFLFLLLWSSTSFAQAKSLQFSEGFSNSSSWRQNALAEITKLSFLKVTASADLPFDFILGTQNLEKVLLFKEGLSAQDKIESDGYFTLNFEDRSYFVVNVGFSKHEFKDLQRMMKRERSSAGLFSLFMVQAHAAEICAKKPMLFHGITAVQAHLLDSELISRVSKCILDGAVAQGDETIEFFKKLVKDPAALASEMRESFLQLKDFVLSIKSEVLNILDGLDEIPLKDKMEFTCQLVGKALMAGGMAVITVGTAAKALPSIILQLQAAGKTLKALSDLKKLGFKVPPSAMQEVLRCGA